MDNLPVFKKCCFCVPLRYGLLTWGYLKLVTALIVVSSFIMFVIQDGGRILCIILFHIIILGAVIVTTEIIIHILFIIGIHRKILKFIRLYYYYNLTMLIVTILMFLLLIGIFVFVRINNNNSNSSNRLELILIIMGFLFSIAVQSFLLLSIRSEIIKLRSNCPYIFVKNAKEPEGTINSVKDDEDIPVDNGALFEKRTEPSLNKNIV